MPGGLGRFLHGVLVLGVMAARSHTLPRSARSRVKRTLLRTGAGIIDPLLAQATVGLGGIPLDTRPRHRLVPFSASPWGRMAAGHPSPCARLSVDPPWGSCRGTRLGLSGDNRHLRALVIVVSIEKPLPVAAPVPGLLFPRFLIALRMGHYTERVGLPARLIRLMKNGHTRQNGLSGLMCTSAGSGGFGERGLMSGRPATAPESHMPWADHFEAICRLSPEKPAAVGGAMKPLQSWPAGCRLRPPWPRAAEQCPSSCAIRGSPRRCFWESGRREPRFLRAWL